MFSPFVFYLCKSSMIKKQASKVKKVRRKTSQNAPSWGEKEKKKRRKEKEKKEAHSPMACQAPSCSY